MFCETTKRTKMTKRGWLAIVRCIKISRISRIFVLTGENLAVFAHEHHILLVINLIFEKMGKRIGNGNFSFLPVPLVSSVTYQSKPPKSILVAGQRLDKIIFCLKAI